MAGRRGARVLLAALLIGAPAAARVRVVRLGPVRIRGAHAAMAGPFVTQSLDFPNDVLLRSASVRLLGPDGEEEADQSLLCHVTLADADGTLVAGQAPHLLTLDLGTRRLELPAGYGILLKANRRYLLNAMLFSADPAIDQSRLFEVSLDADDAAGSAATRPVAARTVGLRAEDAGAAPVTGPFDWLVPPGRHSYSRILLNPETETMRAISAHLHRYARSVSIAEKDTGKIVFSGEVERGPDGMLRRAPVWNRAEPLVLRGGTRYVWTVVYDNSGREPARAMATFYLFADP
jgi:hypothetical protein